MNDVCVNNFALYEDISEDLELEHFEVTNTIKKLHVCGSVCETETETEITSFVLGTMCNFSETFSTTEVSSS